MRITEQQEEEKKYLIENLKVMKIELQKENSDFKFLEILYEHQIKRIKENF